MTQELILNDKVHIVTAFATPETVNPVSDQCEINGMPCVTNDDPLKFRSLRAEKVIRRSPSNGPTTSFLKAPRRSAACWRRGPA